MKITGVEAIYVRQKEVKYQCDSGQDALIVKVTTDAGITGIGEVDSNPLGAKGIIEGPFSHTTAAGLASLVIGEDPFETEKIWHKMYRGNIYGGRRGVGLHAMSGIDHGAVGYQGQGARACPFGNCSAADSIRRSAHMRVRCSVPHRKHRRTGSQAQGSGIHCREIRLGSDGSGSRRQTRALVRRREKVSAPSPIF